MIPKRIREPGDGYQNRGHGCTSGREGHDVRFELVDELDDNNQRLFRESGYGMDGRGLATGRVNGLAPTNPDGGSEWEVDDALFDQDLRYS